MTESLPIVYADDCLIAVHKPAGLLVHRTDLDRHETRFALQIVRDQIGRHVWPVHRLDRGTSGILVFALDPGAARDLGRQFESGTVGKDYVAIVRGHPAASGIIDHPLKRQSDPYEWKGDEAAETPQPAVTRFRRLAAVELPIAVDRYPTTRYALLALEPLTGRRHQIRRHLKHISHPIIGDSTYGKGRHNRLFSERFGCDRLLLACTRLTLRHPASGLPLEMKTPPAEDFLRVAASLGWPLQET